ncbi:hypothetical protein NA57DRAFT_43953 [Rhizodiscina lignyota]|uniref:Uncharacterized protein n=1 Tax=Rhizodiscina lignyota TaxID=1504668 RepID=A0A9P4I622_9PEZI|nr:hypothetical protein NA57DRAFT_43953 [Rhizodiscina lignyota]
MADYVGWFNQSNSRGTMSLMQGCLSAIILCTWDALHLNVPSDDDSYRTTLLRQLKWTLFGILAPEWLAIFALREWFEATRWLDREIDVVAALSAWTRVHSHFVYMGGFNIIFPDGKRYRLNAPQFLALLKVRYIDPPHMLKKEIKDKSKADHLGKGLACLQMLWLVVYLIIRTAQHLPVTTLELFALSVVCCTLFNYVALWEKPKQVEQAVDIQALHANDEIMAILEQHEDIFSFPGRRISLKDNVGRNCTNSGYFVFIYALPTFAFGTCHLIGWQLSFASEVERNLFRSSGIGCLVIPLTLLCLGDVMQNVSGLWKQLVNILIFLITMLYVLLRIYLIIEVFAGLRQVRAAVYQDVNWAQFIPHIGS